MKLRISSKTISNELVILLAFYLWCSCFYSW